jgi:hypothetical protein
MDLGVSWGWWLTHSKGVPFESGIHKVEWQANHRRVVSASWFPTTSDLQKEEKSGNDTFWSGRRGGGRGKKRKPGKDEPTVAVGHKDVGLEKKKEDGFVPLKCSHALLTPRAAPFTDIQAYKH